MLAASAQNPARGVSRAPPVVPIRVSVSACWSRTVLWVVVVMAAMLRGTDTGRTRVRHWSGHRPRVLARRATIPVHRARVLTGATGTREADRGDTAHLCRHHTDQELLMTTKITIIFDNPDDPSAFE